MAEPAPTTVRTRGAELALWIDGEDRRGTILLLHGFPDCARSFRHQVPPLVAAGYRVVRPALRGYFPSSLARDGRYDVSALADDVCDLADALAPGRTFDLVGHDWGAVIAYAVAAQQPARVRTLTTLAVPPLGPSLRRWSHPAQLWASRYMLAFQRREAGPELLAQRLAPIDRLWERWSPGWRLPDDERRAVHEALGRPEHLEAALGYYRALPRSLGDARLRRWLLGPVEPRSLYLHGRADGCVLVATVRGAERALRNGTVKLLDQAGHFLHQERPQEVNRLLLEHLGVANPET